MGDGEKLAQPRVIRSEKLSEGIRGEWKRGGGSWQEVKRDDKHSFTPNHPSGGSGGRGKSLKRGSEGSRDVVADT